MKIYKGNGDILDNYSEEEIFYAVTGLKPEPKKKYYSPLRSDNHPNCFFKRTGKRLLLYDYALSNKGFSCFDVALHKYQCDFKDLIPILNGLLQKSKPMKIEKVKKTSQGKVDIKIITEEWNEYNIEYWRQFDIKRQLLINHNVYYCKEVWMSVKSNYFRKFTFSPTFAYTYPSGRMKIYSPYGYNKHFGNAQRIDLFGLYDSNKSTIVTSSPKDVLVIKNIIGDKKNVVAPLSESIYPEGLNDVTLLWDNDSTGRRYTEKFVAEYGCKYRFVPEEYEQKDVSDLYLYDKEIAIEFIKTL